MRVRRVGAYDRGQAHGSSADTFVPTAVGELLVSQHDRSLRRMRVAQELFEAQETAIIRTLVPRGTTMLDVGANVGYFTALGAQCTGAEGIVHAFEPDVENLRRLKFNVERLCPGNVDLQALALSDRGGSRDLYLSDTNHGRHSFGRANVPNVKACAPVETTTLDEFLETHPTSHQVMLKIDVEGAEGDVLRGARKTLERPGIAVWLECWPEGLRALGTDPVELLEWLGGFGFRAAVYDDRKLTPIRLRQFAHQLNSRNRKIDYLLLTKDAAEIPAACAAAASAPQTRLEAQ